MASRPAFNPSWYWRKGYLNEGLTNSAETFRRRRNTSCETDESVRYFLKTFQFLLLSYFKLFALAFWALRAAFLAAFTSSLIGLCSLSWVSSFLLLRFRFFARSSSHLSQRDFVQIVLQWPKFCPRFSARVIEPRDT